MSDDVMKEGTAAATESVDNAEPDVNVKRRKKKSRPKHTVVKDSKLDRINIDLKKRFGVKEIDYVVNNGIVQNGWLISNARAIDEAIQLLQAQTAPIYILGRLASAVVMWSLTRSKTVKGELWIDSNLKDSFDTAGPVDYEMIKQYLVDWCTQVSLE